MENHNNQGGVGLRDYIQQEVNQQHHQNLELVEKVARIEVQQTAIKEQQDRIERHVETLHSSLTDEIRSSVGGRISDISTLLIQQQDAQNKIIDIQGRQGQQIEQIEKTLREFTHIQSVSSDHEIRIKNLEKRMCKIDEVEKTHIQSRTSLIVAALSGLFGLVGTLLAIFLK